MHSFSNMIGRPVVLYTDQGAKVGILESVSERGVTLRQLPARDRHGLDAQHVLFGLGAIPWRAIFGLCGLFLGRGGGGGPLGGLGQLFGGLGGLGGGAGAGAAGSGAAGGALGGLGSLPFLW